MRMFLHITQQKDFSNCQRQSAVRAYDISIMCLKYCLHRVCNICYGYTTQYHWSTQMHRHVHMHTCNIHMCACTSFTTCNTSSFIQCSSVPNLLIVKTIWQGILKNQYETCFEKLWNLWNMHNVARKHARYISLQQTNFFTLCQNLQNRHE